MNALKKNLILIACTGLTLLLTGCSLIPGRTHMEPTETAPQKVLETVPQATTEAPPETTVPLADPLQEVLENGHSFYQAGFQDVQETTLKAYLDAFTDGVNSGTVTQYARVDLDQDGKPEMVLQLAMGANTDLGVLVLHEEDDGVWGYTFYIRQMGSIKEDGTFHWSSSAAENGIATIRFSHGEYEYQNIAWSEDTEGGAKQYLHGAEITLEEYSEFMNQVSAQKEPDWIPVAG